eukprot:1124100-Alexandrium_andersonii.AAC.1
MYAAHVAQVQSVQVAVLRASPRLQADPVRRIRTRRATTAIVGLPAQESQVVASDLVRVQAAHAFMGPSVRYDTLS